MTLPEKGWKGYGSPGHKYDDLRKLWRDAMRDPKVAEDVALHDWHSEIAEYRMEHEGIKPELLAYIVGLGKAVK